MPDSGGDNEIILPDVLRRLRDEARVINQAVAQVVWLLDAAGQEAASALRMVATIDAALERSWAALAALAAMAPALEHALKRAIPRNWDLDRVDVEAGLAIVGEEGVPLAWVPDTELVVSMVGASNREDRIRLLLAHEGEGLAQCRCCLDECTEADLTEQVYLASRALDAYGAGFREPAQALSVVIAEAVTTEFVAGSPARNVYAKAVAEIPDADAATIFFELRKLVAMTPIRRFYAEWYPSVGQPPPQELSRHATAHHATREHYRHENSLMALMLVVSLLREVQEWKATGMI
jgi:hypothetical protein